MRSQLTKRTPKCQKKLVAIDLFAGGGGLILGLKSAGFRVGGTVEIDGLVAETYANNHREVRLWTIRRLNAADVRRSLGLKKRQLDVLAGCPPCQGSSSLPAKNGAKVVNVTLETRWSGSSC